ncbi:MAG: FAD:protein FMN transferase [Clostridiales bacterium]|nr:FAD:protein FMN transferase [Clostridiales bacterium]
MYRLTHKPLATALALVVAVSAPATLTGCADRPANSVVSSREALGTVVSVTAYGSETDPEGAVTRAIDNAFAAMSAAEAELDAHDPESAIARINASPQPQTEPLPARAQRILDAICALEMREWFSPQLWAATQLWRFEDGGHVPHEAQLAAALADARYDFGGAAKGVALDEAAGALRDSGGVSAALIASGSTTLAIGSKPDGEPWRIGIEDPREPEKFIATVEATGDITVSTSGDYQRFFERSGVRYHHILDPATGKPTFGFRSLTVVGDIDGLDSDILSTALFVAGPAFALRYAEEHGLGLVVVDAGGRTHIVPGPDDRTYQIVPVAQDAGNTLPPPP